MAKIRKLYDEAIKPDGTKQVIYPITSTRAVYTTSNITVDAVLGEGYRFGGVVGPTDSPSFLDQRVFYAASIPGVYTNFGGISVNGGEAVFLIYDGISWSKGVFGGAGYSNLSGFVVLDSISELPREKTTLGYLIADESLPVGFSKEILYVWVGEHGDTLDGLYQNCGQLRGASAYEVAVWNGYEGTQEEWLNDPVNGIKGISVQSFEIEGEYNPAESAVNTYKVTLSNGDSLEMPIKNGSGIKQIEAETISYENGGISTYKITLSDNREYTFQVRNGKTSCGLFGTAEALAEKYPSPEVGDYAFVGSAFPALIYVCNTAGEWTNTEETYDGDNVDLTEYAKSEDVGYYIQNPEYVRVYTDAEDKILWGIKADGTIYFGAGVPPQIVDYVEAAVASVTPQGYEEVLAFLDDAMATDKTLAQLLAERDEAIQAVDGKIDAETLRATEAEDAKVDKVEGESLVNSDFANGIQYIDNPEFVEVKVDSEDKILEAIKADGSKYIGGDLTVNGEIINPGFDAKIDAAIEEMKAEVQETIEEITKDLDVETLSSFSTNENPEYISVTTDSEDKILEGIKSDGTKEINLPTVINNDLQVLGSLDISGATYSNADNPEYIQVEVDSEDKILSARKTDGTKVENAGLEVKGTIDIDGATYSLCQSPEWIKVLVDSQERIIAGVRTDGSVYINKIEGLEEKITQELSAAINALKDYVDSEDAQLSEKIGYDERETVPSYYYTNNYLQNKVESIKSIYSDCAANGDIFFFSTDEHWEYNAKRSPALVKYIIDRVRIDKLISGGDNTQLVSLGNTSNKQNPAVDDFLSLREKTFKGKLYYAIGNHEYLTGYFDNPNLFDNVDMNNWHDMTRFSGLDEIVYGDTARHYYYVDNKQKKIRYIFLSAFKQKEVQQEEQGYRIIAKADYNDSQVAWLQDVALNVESEWAIIVVTHCLSSINPIISEGHCTQVIKYLSEDSKKIAKVLLQYNGNGEIACIISGHLHADGIFMIDDNYVGLEGAEATGKSIPEIVTTCDTGGIDGYQRWVLYGDYSSRAENTITEQAFDVVIIDKNTKKISLVRIGAPAYNIFEQDVETGYYPLSGDIEIREVNYGQ